LIFLSEAAVFYPSHPIIALHISLPKKPTAILEFDSFFLIALPADQPHHYHSYQLFRRFYLTGANPFP